MTGSKTRTNTKASRVGVVCTYHGGVGVRCYEHRLAVSHQSPHDMSDSRRLPCARHACSEQLR
jgi:hypothetical protein